MSWKSLKILAVLPCILIGNLVSVIDLGSLPARIKQLSWLRELYLSNCKMLRSLPELPLQVQLLDACHCEQRQSLPDLPSCPEELPISILDSTSKHSLGSTHQGFSRSTMELIFTDCLKLNGEPSNILEDLRLKILHLAIASLRLFYKEGCNYFSLFLFLLKSEIMV